MSRCSPGIQVEAVSLVKNEVKGIVFASPLYFWTVSARIKAFVERFYCIAEEDENPPFALVNYIGFHDKGMLLAGGCGDTNGKPKIGQTTHLQTAYEFGKNIYSE